MRRLSIALIIVLLFTTLSEHIPEVSSQLDRQLPSSLVFTVAVPNENSEEPTPFASPFDYSIVLLDAETLDTSIIYTNNEVTGLRVMSWSPRGDLLIVLLKHLPDLSSPTGEIPPNKEYCVLTLQGELLRCFEDKPPSAIYAINDAEEEYVVTWSDDSEQVYYVAEYDFQVRRLIEVDVSTGERLRTLYEVEYNSIKKDLTEEPHEPPQIAWTPDLGYLMIRLRAPTQENFIINTSSSERYDFQNSDIDVDNSRICDSFSPQGNFLTMIDSNNQIIILTPQLDVVHMLDFRDSSEQAMVYCPIWTEDERLLYIFVRYGIDNLTRVYDLEQGQIVREITDINRLFTVSPDGTLLALHYDRIHILFPDDYLWDVAESYPSSSFPVWGPME